MLDLSQNQNYSSHTTMMDNLLSLSTLEDDTKLRKLYIKTNINKVKGEAEITEIKVEQLIEKSKLEAELHKETNSIVKSIKLAILGELESRTTDWLTETDKTIKEQLKISIYKDAKKLGLSLDLNI